eukprot:Seg1345.15 transcript_id=Seg1345.15/GoldUCD/mRNA.D3Y31 product="hypothetical protein" protein_id=Seg1345.15/GoldUCD/D3Y31
MYLSPSSKERRHYASFNDILDQGKTIDENATNENDKNFQNSGSRSPRSRSPRFLRRLLPKKYKKLQRSKSDDDLPRKTVNISLDDAFDKAVRDRSRTVPVVEQWVESDSKNRRRAAVSEGDEDAKEGFTRTVETFIINKNLDDYGF